MDSIELKNEIKTYGNTFFAIVFLSITFRNLYTDFNISLPVTFSNFLMELLILIPMIPYIIANKSNFKERFGFNKIRIKTLFLCFILVIDIWPIIACCNLISQFFVPNVVVRSQEAFSKANPIILFISMTIFGPFVEELCFRGFFFNGYKKITSLIKAACLSSLMFALIHMNINQFCYAFVIGIFLALAKYYSKSIYSSFFMHFVINLPTVLFMVKSKNTEIESISVFEMNLNIKLMLLIIFLIISVFSVLISIPIFNGIKKSEEREDEEKNTRLQNEKVINQSCIAGIILSFFYMIFCDLILPRL